MKNFITKANLSGGDDSGTATKWGAKESNSVTDELKLAVTATDQSLTAGTGNDPSPDLLAKALTITAQTAHSYQDSGVADVYVLSRTGSLEQPVSYILDSRLTFITANVNTGASTVNVSGLGVKKILAPGGALLVGGEITANEKIEIFYDPTADSSAGAWILAPWSVNTLKHVDDLAELLALSVGSSSQASVKSFFVGLNKGGGFFYYDPAVNKTTANGGTIIDPDTIGGFDGTPSTRNAYLAAQGTGVGSGCWVKLYYNQLFYEMFGALGDDSNDDTVALQSTLDVSTYDVHGLNGSTYKITAAVHNTVSNRSIIGNRATIHQATEGVGGIVIGHDGVSFVKTDSVVFSGWNLTGSILPTGAAGYGVVISGPATDPWTELIGCQKAKVLDCDMSGFTGGVSAVAVNELEVTSCRLGGMQFHSALGAGGYGVLLTTCYNVNIHHNYFTAEAYDRHAIYVSADSARVYNEDNICKKVIIDSNIINWTDTGGSTGFETAIAVRSAHNINITNNIIKDSYGGIDYQLENGDGKNINISNNTFAGIRSDVSTRGAITFLNDTPAGERASNVSITGNVISLITGTTEGIATNYCDDVTIFGNTIKGDAALTTGIGINDTNRAYIGGNTLNITLGNTGIYFQGTCSDIVIGKNFIIGSSYVRHRFFTVPTNLKFDFSRSFMVTSDGIGGYSFFNGDEPVVTSVVNSAFGLDVTFAPEINVGTINISLTSGASGQSVVYNRTAVGQIVTFGAKDFGGLDLPGVSNALTIVGMIVN